MLPNADYGPAVLRQEAVGFGITLTVSRKLPLPKFSVRLRLRGVFRAGMPKTAVDKDGDPARP